VTDAMLKTERMLYGGKARTAGVGDGDRSRTDDGRLDVKFTTPGTPGTKTSPEQLFVAGVREEVKGERGCH